jgi:DinB superfamily
VVETCLVLDRRIQCLTEAALPLLMRRGMSVILCSFVGPHLYRLPRHSTRCLAHLPSQTMTQQTPPLGDSNAWRAFTASVTALVGDSDPVAILAETAAHLRTLIASVPRAALDSTERPGGWSVVGVIEHLADAELVFGYRLRQILTLDRPRLESFDQDRWAAIGAYNDGDVTAALDIFAALRRRHLVLWTNISSVAWDRVGIHGDRGAESLRDMVRIVAGHDLAHRRQIARILARSG